MDKRDLADYLTFIKHSFILWLFKENVLREGVANV